MSHHARRLMAYRQKYIDAAKTYRYDLGTANRVYAILMNYYHNHPNRFLYDEEIPNLPDWETWLLSDIYARASTIFFMTACEEIAKKQIWPTGMALQWHMGRGRILFDLLEAQILEYDGGPYRMAKL